MAPNNDALWGAESGLRHRTAQTRLGLCKHPLRDQGFLELNFVGYDCKLSSDSMNFVKRFFTAWYILTRHLDLSLDKDRNRRVMRLQTLKTIKTIHGYHTSHPNTLANGPLEFSMPLLVWCRNCRSCCMRRASAGDTLPVN